MVWRAALKFDALPSVTPAPHPQHSPVQPPPGNLDPLRSPPPPNVSVSKPQLGTNDANRSLFVWEQFTRQWVMFYNSIDNKSILGETSTKWFKNL